MADSLHAEHIFAVTQGHTKAKQERVKMGLRSSFDEITVMIEGVLVHIYYDHDSLKILDEAKYKGTPLGGKYSAQLHSTHTTPGQEHLHVYAHGDKLFALNKDGTAHDRSHGVRIPNKVARGIQNKFPGFVLPPNNIIESADIVTQALFRFWLLEERKRPTLAGKLLELINDLGNQ